MKIWGICCAANEEAIIGYTISHLFAQGLDGIIVMLNNSTDRTREILLNLNCNGKRPVVLSTKEKAFYQSRFLTELAELAAESFCADWIIPFDADELFYSEDPHFSLAERLRMCTLRGITVPLLNHYATDKDVDLLNPFLSHPWRHVDINPLGKMIFRYESGVLVDDGNHRIFTTNGVLNAQDYGIKARHFSAIDADRWVIKSIANATALEVDPSIPPGIGAHVRMYKHHADVNGPESLKEFYMQHFFFKHPTDKLVYDPAPYRGDL